MTREEFRSISHGVKVQTLEAFVEMFRATNQHNDLIVNVRSSQTARSMELSMLLDSYRAYGDLEKGKTTVRQLMRNRYSYY
jgi:flagellar biosynthesis/type III secretory pathway chaperone